MLLSDSKISDKRFEVAVVVADKIERQRPIELTRIMHFSEHRHAEVMRGIGKLARLGVDHRRHDCHEGRSSGHPTLPPRLKRGRP